MYQTPASNQLIVYYLIQWNIVIAQFKIVVEGEGGSYCTQIRDTHFLRIINLKITRKLYKLPLVIYNDEDKYKWPIWY